MLPPEPGRGREADEVVRLAVIGRPNVGKSSLVNRFVGDERVIVADEAGTTRDAIDLPLLVDGRPVVIVDTAGHAPPVEGHRVGRVLHHAALAARRRARRRRDRRLRRRRRRHRAGPAGRRPRDARRVRDARRCSTSGTPRRPISTSTTSARASPRSCASARRVLTVSALNGRNVSRVLSEALALADRRAARIPTPELNRFLGETVQERQPPAKQGHRLKLLYMSQIGTRPPRYAIQVNSHTRVTRDYAYFIENRMRERYGLAGVPIVIDFVERGERRGEPRPSARQGRRGGA